jgi:hypothetical protein
MGLSANAKAKSFRRGYTLCFWDSFVLIFLEAGDGKGEEREEIMSTFIYYP